MLMILSTWSMPVDPVVRAGPQLRLVEPVGDRRVERLVDQRGLAGPRDPGDAAEDAEGDRHVDLLQVVLPRPLDDQLAAGLPALLRNRDLPLARQELTGHRRRIGLDLLRGSLGDHVAAVLARARAKVDDVVRRAHGPLVVLDHDHGVAQVAQPLQRLDQLGVVALVQADRGLVEDVEDTDQAGADLRRESDPLRLSARQRPGGARQVQIADADVVQEGEALVDLADQQPGDRLLGVGHLELVDPLQRGPRRELAVLGDRDPTDLDREALRPQPRSLAVRARLLGHVALDPLAHAVRVRLLVAALEVVDDSLEADAVGAPPAEAVRVVDLVPFAAGAVEEDLAVLGGELLPGRVRIDSVVLGHRLDQPLPVPGVPDPPGLQRALGQGERRVRHDQLGVDDALEAETVAALAGAMGRVEGEDPRLQLRDRRAAVEAGEALAEGEAIDHALRELTGSLGSLDTADVLATRATLRLTGASLGENVHLDDATGQPGGGLHRLR